MALAKWSPSDQLALLKGGYVALCILDAIHWCFLIYNEYLPNVWYFYSSWENIETLYLVVRLSADILVGGVGLGVAIWGRCLLLIVPCLIVQSGFIISRTIVWIRRGPLPFTPTATETFYIGAEFAMPFAWCICALATVKVLNSLRLFEFVDELDQPPVTILTLEDKTSADDDNPAAQMVS